MADHALRNWLLGIVATLITLAISAGANLLFTNNARIAALEATQSLMIDQINRVLNAFDELPRQDGD